MATTTRRRKRVGGSQRDNKSVLSSATMGRMGGNGKKGLSCVLLASRGYSQMDRARRAD